MVAIIGGGGKTSLMVYLQEDLLANGLTAVAATTTRLARLSSCCFRPIASLEEGCGAVEDALRRSEPVTLVAGEAAGEPNKLAGIPPEWVDRLAARFGDTVFIVEGDGSAGRSLKGHLAHEPVIPAASGLVIAVVGIDILGAPLTMEKVHRPERVAQLTGAKPGAEVTVDLVARLLLHPEGYLRQCPPTSRVVLFINKVESPEQHRQAIELAEAVLAPGQNRIEAMVIGSMHRQEFFLVEAEE